MSDTKLTSEEVAVAVHAVYLYVQTPGYTGKLRDFNQWLREQIE